MRQDSHEVAEVDPLGALAGAVALLGRGAAVQAAVDAAVAAAAAAGLGVAEEGVDDAVAEGVDGQLGDAEEVLAGEVALLLLVQ